MERAQYNQSLSFEFIKGFDYHTKNYSREVRKKVTPEFSNQSLPCASPKLELRHSEEATRGRYVVASQELKAGGYHFSKKKISVYI